MLRQSDQLIVLLSLLVCAAVWLSFLAVVEANGSQKAQIAADISNGLGWKIFSCLSSSTSSYTNLLFSPISITTTLAIMYYGALGNSSVKIRCEIASLLQSSSSPASLCSDQSSHDIKEDNKSVAGMSNKECYCSHGIYFRSLLFALLAYDTDNVTIDISNGIWHHGRLHSLFKHKLMNYFRPQLMMFTPDKPEVTASSINQWVDNITHGKISDIINTENIKEDDKVLLFNVLYFKGLWNEPFTAHIYSSKHFITCTACHNNTVNLTAKGAVENVEYMEKEEYVPYCKMSTLTAIQIPYVNRNVTMTIILPNLCSMRKTEDELTSGDLLQHINNCLSPNKIKIVLPKFDVQQQLPINSILSRLGLYSLYSSDDGGFSTFLKKSHNLQLSTVTHQSVLEVNEKGSEAAAATGVIFKAVSFLPEFKASHPFIVLISEHTTGAVLFMARLCSPLTKNGLVDIKSGPYCGRNLFSGSGQSD